MSKLILATTSPHRKALFDTYGIKYTAEGSNVDEYKEDRPNTPRELVLYLARLKAESVAQNHKEGIIVGFDSAGYFEGTILEKPKDREEAFLRLKALSGKIHHFFTGIHLINLNTNQTLNEVVMTEIEMREISDLEINKYLEVDKNVFTYALGYDPNAHLSSTFVKRINGSYLNITRGFPGENVIPLLYEIGFVLE